MRRIINFRAPLFVAIGFVLGILSFYEFLFGDFLFGLVVLILVIALGATLFALKYKVWLGAVAVLAAVILGFALSNLNYVILNKNEAINKEVVISGRVCDLNRNGVEKGAVYLENCVDSKGVKYGGHIRTYLFDTAVNAGDILTLRGKLNSTYPVKGDMQTYYLRINVRYELSAQSVVSQNSGDLKLDEKIRKYVYDTSISYAPQNGDVLYALLTGDRSALSADKEESFKLAGIVHLLAVSGLHVGFVVTVLCLVLKRFKLHPLVECGIILIPLIFYAYVCSFTPSVIRAIVMVVCAYVARALFGRYDLLTSLAFAVLVILLISPFNLFDVGFQLSALSVYGIATLYGTLNRLLAKRKIPKVVRAVINALAVSLSCTVATFFTLQINYGYAPTLGLLLNLLAIPLVSVSFVIGWFGLLPWVFHYVMWAVDWILQAVVVAARWVASLSFATVSVAALGVTVVAVAVWLFVLGGYVNLTKIGKIVVNSVLAVVVAFCVGLSYVKSDARNQVYITYGYNDVVCVATSADGEAVIVGNFSDNYAYVKAAEYLSRFKVSSCTLYVTDYSVSNASIVEDACKRFGVDTAYKLTPAYNAAVDEVMSVCDVAVYRHMENTSSGDSVTVTPIFDGELRAAVVKVNGLTVTSLYGSDFAIARYLDYGLPSDVYVMRNANEEYSNRDLNTLSFYQSQLPLNYGANKYGNFTITQKDDTIRVKFR